MMLKIEADTGKLDAKLKQSEAGVRKLEASVKIGDRTMRASVTTEEQLAKALDKFEAAAIRASEAGKQKAAASLQSQRSSALYAQFLAKEREELAATAAEERRAASLAKQKSKALEEQFRAQERLTAANKKAAAAEAEKRTAIGAGWAETARRAAGEAEDANFKRSQKRLAALQQAQEAQAGAWKRGAGAAAGMVAGIVGIGSAAAAASLLVNGLTAAHEHQMDVATRSNQAAAGMKEFVALQAEGDEGKAHVKDTILKAARAGVKSADAAAMAQPIQSVVDSDGDGKLNEEEKAKFDEDYQASLRLKQIGVEAKDAATVITGNRTKGIGGNAAADKLIAAADKSVGGPADFARAASAINQFEDSDTGLAAATALTAEGTPLEQLPTLVRSAALTLGSANDESEFSKKFGLAGLSEAEKVAKLREEGDRRGTGDTREARIADFSRSFKSKEGGSLDEEKARAMGLLVRQGDLFGSTLEAVGGEGVAGLTEGKVKALKEDPITGSQMRSDEAAALAEANTVYGPEAEAARDARAKALARGAEMQRFGGGQGVNEDGTEKSGFGWDRIVGRAKAKWNGMEGGLGRGGEDGEALLDEQLGKLDAELRTRPAAEPLTAPEEKTYTPLDIEAPKGYEAKRPDAEAPKGYEAKRPDAGAPKGYEAARPGADKGVEQSMNKLQQALERNTAATEANSASSKGKTPVGGAASNAEEKY